jgi:hypothetical protein
VCVYFVSFARLKYLKKIWVVVSSVYRLFEIYGLLNKGEEFFNRKEMFVKWNLLEQKILIKEFITSKGWMMVIMLSA